MDWCSHEEVLIFLSFCVLGLFGVLSFEDFEDAWSVITKHFGPTRRSGGDTGKPGLINWVLF